MTFKIKFCFRVSTDSDDPDHLQVCAQFLVKMHDLPDRILAYQQRLLLSQLAGQMTRGGHNHHQVARKVHDVGRIFEDVEDRSVGYRSQNVTRGIADN